MASFQKATISKCIYSFNYQCNTIIESMFYKNKTWGMIIIKKHFRFIANLQSAIISKTFSSNYILSINIRKQYLIRCQIFKLK
jgi:hypothetical protein